MAHEFEACERTHLAFSPDRLHFASGTKKGYAIRRVSDWKIVSFFSIDQETERAGRVLNFSPDGRIFAMVRSYNNLVLVDTRDWSEIADIQGQHDVLIRRIRFSPTGMFLGAACSASMFQIWDLERIRFELRKFDLDWEGQRLPEKKIPKEELSISVRVRGESLASRKITELPLTFPARASTLPKQALDLSGYYLRNFESSDLPEQDQFLAAFHAMTSCDSDFNGVKFDVRGALTVGALSQENQVFEPSSKIPFGRRARRIHVLQGVRGQTFAGREVAGCNIEYADGWIERKHFLYGHDLSDMVFNASEPPVPGAAAPVWIGKAPSGQAVRIFSACLEKLRDEEIHSLQFFSAFNELPVYVLAVTSED
jgi:hypothetical protein